MENAQTTTTIADERKQQKKIVLGFLLKLVVTAVVFTLIFSFVLGMSVAQGEQMYPRIRDGDLLLWYRLSRDYNVGDVVTFRSGSQRIVGRVAAVGGETVELSETGEIVVNGNVRDEEVFYPTNADTAEIDFPYSVEKGSVFLLCDFRTNAQDSRNFGAVPEQEIDGKIMSLLRRRGI